MLVHFVAQFIVIGPSVLVFLNPFLGKSPGLNFGKNFFGKSVVVGDKIVVNTNVFEVVGENIYVINTVNNAIDEYRLYTIRKKLACPIQS